MINKIENKDMYDKLVEANGFSFLQSWEWGEVKRGSWKAVRISIDEIPVSVFIRKIPILKKSFGYIPRGFNENLTESILIQLRAYCRAELNLSHLIIEPNIESSQKIEELFEKADFIKSGKTMQPNWTNVVDLRKDWEELFGNFKATYRRNIRKASKLGLECEIISDGEEGLKRFYEVLKVIMARTKYVMHGYDYFKKIWEIMSKSGFAKIFIATKDGEDLGAIFMFYDSYGAYEMYGGVRDEGKKFRTGFYLREKTMQDSQEMGKKFYDQWGVAPFSDEGYEKEDELYGISLFKEGFGGENIEFLPQYTYVFDSLPYRFYRLGLMLNNLKIRLSKFGR